MSGQVSTRGVGYTKHLDETLRKGIYETQIPNINFLYQFSTTRNPEYHIGDRVCLPDGRVFRYAMTHDEGGILTWQPGRGVLFCGNMTDDGVASNVDRAQVVGDSELHYASQSFAKDELRGGYAIVYSAGNTYQQAGIVGNTYCSTSAMTVYLDRELSVVVTSTQYTELLPNPYRYISTHVGGGEQRGSWAGIPMSYPTAVDTYFWLQTWGPCWVNPGAVGIGAGDNEREAVFMGDGSVRPRDATTYIAAQLAGFAIEFSAGADGPPFINLQINP